MGTLFDLIISHYVIRRVSTHGTTGTCMLFDCSSCMLLLLDARSYLLLRDFFVSTVLRPKPTTGIFYSPGFQPFL
jgi:hypothetical protein